MIQFEYDVAADLLKLTAIILFCAKNIFSVLQNSQRDVNFRKLLAISELTSNNIFTYRLDINFEFGVEESSGYLANMKKIKKHFSRVFNLCFCCFLKNNENDLPEAGKTFYCFYCFCFENFR